MEDRACLAARRTDSITRLGFTGAVDFARHTVGLARHKVVGFAEVMQPIDTLGIAVGQQPNTASTPSTRTMGDWRSANKDARRGYQRTGGREVLILAAYRNYFRVSTASPPMGLKTIKPPSDNGDHSAETEVAEKKSVPIDSLFFFAYRNCFRAFTASPRMGAAAAQTGRTAALLNQRQQKIWKSRLQGSRTFALNVQVESPTSFASACQCR
jgi:hypothetical protein